MRIKFWGVRGSIPAPGPETNRYGGNTACVSITTATGALLGRGFLRGLGQAQAFSFRVYRGGASVRH